MAIHEGGPDVTEAPKGEQLLGKIASRAALATRHAGLGARRVIRGTLAETVATADTVLQAIGIKPEPEYTPERAYRSRLEYFEATIRDRVPFMEDELASSLADAHSATDGERDWIIYKAVKDGIGFSDGLYWLRLAAEEKHPGQHIETDDWLQGRIEDYSALLTLHGLRSDKAQLLNIGLHRHRQMYGDAFIAPAAEPLQANTEPRDPMAC